MLHRAYEGTIPAHGKGIVKTDIAMAIPGGYYGRVGEACVVLCPAVDLVSTTDLAVWRCAAPRSGLAVKAHIDVGAGVIDADYRGNVGVVLFNHGEAEFKVKPGDRIAQLIITKIETPDMVEVGSIEELGDTVRGEGGYGSTGVEKVVSPKRQALAPAGN